MELVQNPASYFWMKLILAPTLLVIGIVVAIKGLFSAVSVTLGSNRLSYRYPLGAEKQHKISDVMDWNEEMVKNKSSIYKQLTIQLSNGKKIKLSNQENSDYEKVIGYLKKKVKVKK